MKRTWIVIAILTALLAGGCSQPAEKSTDDTSLRVLVQPLATTLPFHVAQEEGFFERNGLDIEAGDAPDIGTAFNSLTSGHADIVLSAITAVLVGAERGFDVEIVSSLQRSSPESLGTVWITKDPAIASIKDLKGKTIAVPALTGALADSLIYLLQREDVSRDDVKLVAVPFANMADQLDAGRVDAAIAGQPFSNAMEARGFTLHGDVGVDAVMLASNGAQNEAIGALFAGMKPFADENPDVIRAFRKSLQEAIDFLYANPEKAREYLQNWAKMPPQVAATLRLPLWTVDLTADEIEPYVTIGREVGTLKEQPDLSSLIWHDR